MKKIGIFSVILCIGFINLSAQFSMEALEVGARVGYNKTFAAGDAVDTYNIKGKSGYDIGLFVEVPISERLSIQPEVKYSLQALNAEPSNYKAEIKVQNIEIPILVKYYIFEGFNFQVGPQIGFNTGNDSDFGNLIKTYNLIYPNDPVSEDELNDLYNKVILSGVIGGGYKFPIGMTLDIRYNIGFTDVLATADFLKGRLDGLGKFRNSALSLSAGYAF